MFKNFKLIKKMLKSRNEIIYKDLVIGIFDLSLHFCHPN